MTNVICQTDAHNTIRWWLNAKGQFHRLDGPARQWADGDKEWWVEGDLHRLDGPACDYVTFSKQWFIAGKQLTQRQFDQHPLVIFHRLCKGAA
jgi:hypothetical protein